MEHKEIPEDWGNGEDESICRRQSCFRDKFLLVSIWTEDNNCAVES